MVGGGMSTDKAALYGYASASYARDLLDTILNHLVDGLTDAEKLYGQLYEDGWPLPQWRHWAEELTNWGFTVSDAGQVTV